MRVLKGVVPENRDFFEMAMSKAKYIGNFMFMSFAAAV
jgi:hypothetical protein